MPELGLRPGIYQRVIRVLARDPGGHRRRRRVDMEPTDGGDEIFDSSVVDALFVDDLKFVRVDVRVAIVDFKVRVYTDDGQSGSGQRRMIMARGAGE
jgi:hypothetical protein